MSSRRKLLLAAVVVLVLMLDRRDAICSTETGVMADDQVCDPLADYFLGMENYSEAVRRHENVIRQQPANALAHYHLGFAFGLMGRHQEELHEYQKAVDLGLSDWQLFLNLGLLYLESSNLNAATEVLRLAALLGPDRPETHFNLGIVYERRAMLAQAQQELLQSLHIDPNQPDARNALAAIYAEEGKYGRAHQEWSELVKANPNYAPARDNLNILERIEHGGSAEPLRPKGLVTTP
ncbi:MAG: tetratricopeptide repeat protein [Candidatus Binataceae bacterium]